MIKRDKKLQAMMAHIQTWFYMHTCPGDDVADLMFSMVIWEDHPRELGWKLLYFARQVIRIS